MNKEDRFNAAYKRAKEILEQYKNIGSSGIFGAAFILHDIQLYESGDRSDALLESMEGIK